MSRLKELRKYVDAELLQMENKEKMISAAAHLYGVSLAATMIAKKRGEDPELASMVCMRIKQVPMTITHIREQNWPEKF